MPERLVPFRHHTYTDVLVAIGTARLVERVLGIPDNKIELHERPAGFGIRYPEPPGDGATGTPFKEVRDKADRTVTEGLTPGQLWDKTAVAEGDRPHWWSTVSVLNSLFSPDSNNKLAQAYTPEVGQELLDGTPVLPANLAGMKRSQLLYAPASKGAAGPTLGTGDTRMKGEDEQALALLGYQQAGSGAIRDPYTVVFVPRPREITLAEYRALVDKTLRGYLPKATSGKILPTRDQTLPFYVAMAYFDFILALFDYQHEATDGYGGFGVGKIVSGLDRVLYYSLGTSSAPAVLDTLAIPDWLDSKAVALDVRDVLRQTLGEHLDPNLLYLPVRAFAEADPRHLVRFYRQVNPLAGAMAAKKKGHRYARLSLNTLTYLMEHAQNGRFAGLNSEPMQRFARAIRSRTLTRLYSEGTQPDFQLLNDLRSASLDDKRLVSMLSAFIGSYNLHHHRNRAAKKRVEGPVLSYDDLQVIIDLIQEHGADFVANTLLAQAMSKRPDEPETAPTDAVTTADA